MVTVAVAYGKGPPVGAERECPHRPNDRAEVADLVARVEARPDLAQRPRVEERHASVIAAHGECAAIAAKRIVEDTCAAAVQHRERRRAPQERSEEIAPRRDRVVEVDALPREQQCAIEAWLDEGLRAEPLRDRRGRLVPCGASRRQCDRARDDRCGEE